MSKRPIPEFSAPRRVLLAAPRGYCAGVDRAVDIVEVALQTYGAPIYVRKQIVHNLHVVRRLEAKGAIFVDEREAAAVKIADPDRVAYLTQTTLSVDETQGVIGVLRDRFPVLAGPRSDDICYATQ